MPVSTLLLVFNEQNQILLCRKKRGFGVGKYNGPGGKQDPWETILACVIRELREETGIVLDASAITPCGLLHFVFDNQPQLDRDVFVFFACECSQIPEETDEMDPFFFPIDAIPYDAMWDADREWIATYVSEKKSFEYTFYYQENGKVRSFVRHE